MSSSSSSSTNRFFQKKKHTAETIDFVTANAQAEIFRSDVEYSDIAEVISWPYPDQFRVDTIIPAKQDTQGFVRITLATSRPDASLTELRDALDIGLYSTFYDCYEIHFRLKIQDEEDTDEDEKTPRKRKADSQSYSPAPKRPKIVVKDPKAIINKYDWKAFEDADNRPATLSDFLNDIELSVEEFSQVFMEYYKMKSGRKPDWFRMVIFAYKKGIASLLDIDL